MSRFTRRASQKKAHCGRLCTVSVLCMQMLRCTTKPIGRMAGEASLSPSFKNCLQYLPLARRHSLRLNAERAASGCCAGVLTSSHRCIVGSEDRAMHELATRPYTRQMGRNLHCLPSAHGKSMRIISHIGKKQWLQHTRALRAQPHRIGKAGFGGQPRPTFVQHHDFLNGSHK